MYLFFNNKMKKKLIIFDMDGTLYLGNDLFDGVKELFEYLKSEGIQYVFFTNNSSHDLEFYYKKMSGFNIPCTLEDNFYSSSEITISYLLKNNVKDIFAIANESLKRKLRKHFNIIDKYEEGRKIDAVVAGFYTELVYEKLQDACLYLETGNPMFVATNGDYRCPIENKRYIPDCGGMIEWIRLTTGKKAEVMGKPNPEVINYFLDKYHLNKEDILVVGDRLYTDIQVGVNAGVDTLCVLSGECTLEDINNYQDKPTYIKDSVTKLINMLKN